MTAQRKLKMILYNNVGCLHRCFHTFCMQKIITTNKKILKISNTSTFQGDVDGHMHDESRPKTLTFVADIAPKKVIRIALISTQGKPRRIAVCNCGLTVPTMGQVSHLLCDTRKLLDNAIAGISRQMCNRAIGTLKSDVQQV